MKYVLATTVAICFASPAFADVTIQSVMDGKVLGFGGRYLGALSLQVVEFNDGMKRYSMRLTSTTCSLSAT
jgi:hypothetical protein